jgi:hypothetical protein
MFLSLQNSDGNFSQMIFFGSPCFRENISNMVISYHLLLLQVLGFGMEKGPQFHFYHLVLPYSASRLPI